MKQEVAALIKANARPVPAVTGTPAKAPASNGTPAKAKSPAKPVILEEEGPEEGGDDGVLADVVDEIEGETADLTNEVPSIDEATFTKFVTAQYSGNVTSRSDYLAISEKAGISAAAGEQIMLHYRVLSDQFPHVLTNAAVRKLPPKAASLGTKAQLQAPAQRRLLKKQ